MLPLPDLNRLRHLLDRALDYPEDRLALLEQLRVDDPSLAHYLKRSLEEYDRTAPPEPPFPDFVSRKIGPYRLNREISRGGMGTVFLAGCEAEGQPAYPVALKLLRFSFADDHAQQAFHRERKVLARLVHPGIACLLDWGAIRGGLLYLVLEYVDGVPITNYCSQNMLSTPNRLQLFEQTCEIVDHAHQHHVVHRDLKPANILVTSAGKVKLLDFGISALLDGNAETPSYLTPTYASPEQLRGEPAAVSNDIYSLGVLLHEILTGALPNSSAGNAIVLKATSRECAQRYQSVKELAAAVASARMM